MYTGMEARVGAGSGVRVRVGVGVAACVSRVGVGRRRWLGVCVRGVRKRSVVIVRVREGGRPGPHTRLRRSGGPGTVRRRRTTGAVCVCVCEGV